MLHGVKGLNETYTDAHSVPIAGYNGFGKYALRVLVMGLK